MTDYFEHIDDYMMGKLSDSQKAAFERAMNEDLELRSAVDNYDLAKEISLGFLEEEVRQVLNETVSNKNGGHRKWWLLAAVFILGVYGYFLIISRITEQPQYAEIYEEPAWPIKRGIETDTLRDALTYGIDGNIPLAKKILLSSSILNSESRYWIAELYAKEANSDSVLVYLPKTPSNQMRRDRINYLKIISLYNLQKHREAKQLIDALPPDTDEWYKTKYLRIAD